MNKLDYLIAACKRGAWRRLVWRLSVFNVCTFPANERPEDYDLTYIDGYPHYWQDEAPSQEPGWIKIEGADKDKELFYAEDRFTMIPDHYPGFEGKVETGVGRYVFNWIVIYYAFGTRMPYLVDQPSPLAYQNEIYKRCLDNEDDDPNNEAAIRPSMVGKFIQGLSEIAPMTIAIAPTGTLRSLSVHPDTYKMRDALLLKHKDELDNPAVIVQIEKALDALDTEWLSGDQSIQFYASKKSRMRRRKLFLMYGIETAFKEGADFTLIPTSLMEENKSGLSYLVDKYNSTREGSFMRGAETAKGGEQVRIIQMIFQNHRIVEGDCGTKLTQVVKITPTNQFMYVGMNSVDNGKLVQLSKDMLKGLLGKTIRIRRPLLCQRGHVDCCAACASADKAKEERAIAADIATGMSNIMLNAMGAMHGRETIVEEFDPLLHIT
ncbi:hypothetical protein pEaSNUABM11_00055 [Erwinia phage pEa_SNUABM_11]|nr:hypothetical protein pEaSNUABM11_00055 [Erwinia phage pEa_SNUABM_11]